MRQNHLLGACAAFAAMLPPLAAQAGNEGIFVGTSTSGSVDTSAFVESATGNVLFTGQSSFTDNVTSAVWANRGRRLYVGQSLGNRVAVATWNGTSPSWAPFYPAPGACYGLGYDAARQRLWVLTGSSGSTRELHCVDADLASPNYGSSIVQTSVLSGASRERWGLSPSGNRAAVPHVFVNSGLFEVVDTDPASPNFLQIVDSATVPNAGGSFTLGSDAAVSADDLYAYLLYAGLGTGGLAVRDLTTQTWLDFDAVTPGQQDFVIPQSVPNRMDLSLDRAFVVISGQGGSGWAARLDIDYVNPGNSTLTQYSGLTIPQANGISLSPDNTRACVTSTPASVSPPGTLVVFDVATGALLQSVPLGNMWNIYTTAWQDASPVASFDPFGSGCSGSLGAPTLAAAPGSRPALGTTFTAVAGNLPFGIAVLQVGLSNTTFGGSVPLPFPLASLGMPGCDLLVDPLASFVLTGGGASANWQWTLPVSEVFFGVNFYAQAFSLDPAANAFGFAASNGGAGSIGY